MSFIKIKIFLFSSGAAGIAAIIQFLSFIIIGRFLGAENYAYILLIQIYVVIFVEFLGPGVGDFTVKSMSNNSAHLSKYISDSFLSMLITLPIIFFIFYLALNFFSKHLSSLVYLLFFSELIASKAISYYDHLNISLKKYNRIYVFKILVATVKFFLALMFFINFGLSGLDGWIIVQAVFSISVFLYVFFELFFINKVKLHLCFNFYRFKQGISFSISQFLRAIGSVTDRYCVEMSFSKAVFSSYSVSFRIMQFSLTPLQVVQKMIYPGYFKAAERSVDNCFLYAKRQLKLVCSAAFISSISIFLFSFFLDGLMGPSYELAGSILKMLSPIPILIAFSNAFQDFMVAIGKSYLRFFCQAFLIFFIIIGFYTFKELSIIGFCMVVLFGYFFTCVMSFLAAIFIVYKDG